MAQRYDHKAMRAERIGRYTIIRRLAQGGMAEVFHAVDDASRPVAIKCILPVLTADRHYVSMFMDEARLLAQLDHPNVVRVFEVGEHHGLPFLVMELLDGVPVSRLRANAEHTKTPLSIAEVLQIGLGATDGLHYAHTRTDADEQPLRIVHRDITPRNLIVTREGAIKIIDFGIARMEDQTVKTRTGATKGTTQYMSPEQCRAQPTDARSDVFSLSIVLWELFAGTRLYLGDSDLDIMLAITESDAPRLSTMAPSAPRVLDDILARGLARDLSRRFTSALELRHALLAAAHQLQLEIPTRELALRVQAHDPLSDHGEGAASIGSLATTKKRGNQSPDVVPVASSGPATRPLHNHHLPTAIAGRRRSRWTWAAVAVVVVAIGILGIIRQTSEPVKPASDAAMKLPPIAAPPPPSEVVTGSAAPSETLPTPAMGSAAPTTTNATTASRTKKPPPPKRASKRKRPPPPPKLDLNTPLPPR